MAALIGYECFLLLLVGSDWNDLMAALIGNDLSL